LNALQHVGCKGINKNTPRCRSIHGTGTEIEQRLGIELADGATVRAFNIIGIDLKLRFGIHLGIAGQQQVVVALLRGSFFARPCALPHDR